MTFSQSELNRYQRHFSLPQFGMEGQEKIKASKVLVVGAGGLGSPVLLYLSAAGVGKIGIIDFDTLSLSNLQRQILYTTDEVGQRKTDLAKKKLSALNNHPELITYEEKLSAKNGLEIIKEYDLVVDCTDNFPTRYLVNDACGILGKPFVYASIYQYEGQVSVFNYDNGPSYRDVFPRPPHPDAVPNCAEGGVLGALAGVMGSLQATEAIKMITGTGTLLSGYLLIYDSLNTSFKKIKLPKPTNRKVVTHLIDYDEFCGITKLKNTMVKEIDVIELKNMMDNEEDFQLIDVREPHEVDIATLNGELIPLGEIAQSEDKINKDKKVVIHCRSGARSAKAVEYLQKKLGKEDIYNLKGGVLAWADQIDPSMKKY